jgi:exodeoxyribonuclease V alpha subunit
MYVRGHINRILHQSEGYFVVSMAVADTDFAVRDKTATISGYICGLKNLRTGVSLEVQGEWVKHPKWGRQLSPYSWRPWAKSNQDRVLFLRECIEGFSDLPRTTIIVETFGEDTFVALGDMSQCHDRIPESVIPREALDAMLLQWSSARTLSNLSMFLHGYDLGPATVNDIYRRFGHDVIEIISSNPYRLTVIDSFTFEKADQVALRLGIPRNDPRRVEGAVLWLLRTQALQGHLFLRRGQLQELLNELVQSEQIEPFDIKDLYGEIQAAVTRLEERKLVTVDGTVGVYLPEMFMYERQGARKLARFLTPSTLKLDLDVFLAEYQQGNQIELSEAQRHAVRRLVEHRVLVLTGLPGTGKTTVIRALVTVFKRSKVSFSLMAPTGIAAKRLALVTGEEAMTIHRTFGYNGVTWNYNGANKFGAGAVIIDELSMVDQELFYRTLDALHHSTMLVLVGDDAQLPSVGPGNVLRELISCPEIPNVRLTQIFRQASTSDIVVASHKINQGKSPLPDSRNPDSEFQFIQMPDEETIARFIVEAAAKLKNRDANFQVLSPKYDGVTGVNHLNELLRERLNPLGSQKEWKMGSFYVRQADRLMVVKNDYNLNIYNGDMGKLHAIEKEHLVVRIHGLGAGAGDALVQIPKGNAHNVLKLAYAITVHKSQGSEFDTILMPISRGHGRMLQRNLFYTAVTRARRKVWLLGEVNAVLRAIANDKVIQRNTILGRSVSDAYRALVDGVSALGNDY